MGPIQLMPSTNKDLFLLPLILDYYIIIIFWAESLKVLLLLARTKEEEKGDFRKYQKKAANAVRKKQILVSLKELVEMKRMCS